MTQVEELQMRIRNLPTADFSELHEWFLQLEDELWDKQISTDFKAGKFDKLIEKARSEFAFDYGKAKPNRFAARLAEEQLMVVVDADLAAVFPTSEAVNEALRVLATAAQNLPTTNSKRQRKPRIATPVPSVQE